MLLQMPIQMANLMMDINMNKITWKNTLYPHAFLGHIEIMRDFAMKLNYPYFVWNGIVYGTENKQPVAPYTGVEDVE